MSKKLMMVLAIAVLSVVTPNVLKAQSKVGHVNFQEIILLMPEYTMAATEYDLYQAALEDNLKQKEDQIMEVQKKYQMESQKKPTPNNPERERTIQRHNYKTRPNHLNPRRNK